MRPPQLHHSSSLKKTPLLHNSNSPDSKSSTAPDTKKRRILADAPLSHSSDLYNTWRYYLTW